VQVRFVTYCQNIAWPSAKLMVVPLVPPAGWLLPGIESYVPFSNVLPFRGDINATATPKFARDFLYSSKKTNVRSAYLIVRTREQCVHDVR
jgi:hypothetical protein